MVGHPADSATSDAPAQPMTKADRANLERLARKQGKVDQARVAERVEWLKADVEDQLTVKYKFDDSLWTDVTSKAHAKFAEWDAEIAAICRDQGLPEDMRPRLTLGWSSRGEQGLASRRAELRKLAYARIEALAASAKVTVEANVVAIERELIVGGLESTEAARFAVESMPTADQLMPQVDVDELKPGRRKNRYGEDEDEWLSRYGGWEPPPGAAAALLTPTSATGREAKRQAFNAALAANPDLSNRELGRLVGRDHKTVGKWRAEGGEIPSDSPALPSGYGKSGEAR